MIQPGSKQSEESRRKERQRQLMLLIAALFLALDKLGSDFAADRIPQGAFLTEAGAVLKSAHHRAAILGSSLAGPAPAYAFPVVVIAIRISDEQMRFLRGFASDIAAGRYEAKSEGGLGAKARRARFGLYAQRLVGTANAAWLAAIAASSREVRWVLGATDDHCETCKREANTGWRNARLLRRVPGDGTTDCMVNCLCHLETREGLRSFALPSGRDVSDV